MLAVVALMWLPVGVASATCCTDTADGADVMSVAQAASVELTDTMDDDCCPPSEDCTGGCRTCGCAAAAKTILAAAALPTLEASAPVRAPSSTPRPTAAEHDTLRRPPRA